jgi:vacuolar-type H+-ATPase subunit I/STV1
MATASTKTKHFQALNKELDEIENDHYQFRQKLIDQKDDPNECSLIKKINKWEEDSIEIIKQTADKCRKRLTKYTNVSIVIIENKLNDLAKHIKKIRQENEFNEMELNQLREKFKKLQEELDKPPYVSIDEESTSFINRIYVITPDEGNHVLFH